MMKKILLIVITILAGTTSLFFVNPVRAQDCSAAGETKYYDGCITAGQCLSSGKKCITGTTVDPVCHVSHTYFIGGNEPCGGGVGQAILGGVKTPRGVWDYNFAAGGGGTNPSIGIIAFISVLLRIFTIVAGLWFMFNMIYAGYMFITSSGDTAVFGKFKDSLFFSLIGLFVIAAAYLIAGLIGAIFFGDAGFIIRPTLFQAGTTAP